MAEQTFEIEKRALLTLEQYNQLTAKIKTEGVKFESVVRVFVDFSALERTSTVCLRIDNGQAKLIVKSGALDAEVRSESTVLLQNDQIENCLDALALMGFKTGSLAVRTITSCNYNGLEYSFRKNIDAKNLNNIVACILEIEGIGVLEDQISISNKITDAFNELGLKPMISEEWVTTITRFHKEINIDYEYNQAMVDKVLNIIDLASKL